MSVKAIVACPMCKGRAEETRNTDGSVALEAKFSVGQVAEAIRSVAVMNAIAVELPLEARLAIARVCLTSGAPYFTLGHVHVVATSAARSRFVDKQLRGINVDGARQAREDGETLLQLVARIVALLSETDHQTAMAEIHGDTLGEKPKIEVVPS